MVKRIWRSAGAVGLLAWVVGVSGGCTGVTGAGPRIREVRLCDAPPNLDSIEISRDVAHFAAVVPRGNGVCLLADGRMGPEFDEISPAKKGGALGIFNINVSPSAHPAIYGARRGKKWVVVNGTAIGPEFDAIGVITVVDDGRSVAYAGRKGAKWCVVINGKQGPMYDEIGNDLVHGTAKITLSPDGTRTAYTARRGSKWMAVVDGQEGPAFDRIGDPRRDSSDGVADCPPLFSSDGKHLVYAAREAGKCVAVIDGKPGPTYDEIFWPMTFPGKATPFSDDARRVAYMARRGNHWLMVIDGHPGPEYDSVMGSWFVGSGKFSLVTPPVFSPNGAHVAYRAQKGNQWVLVFDGRETQAYDTIYSDSPTFSPDSEHIAFTATKNAKVFVVADGQAGPSYDRIGDGGDLAGGPLFSADSRHLLYEAQQGNQYFVVVDGKPGPATAGIRDWGVGYASLDEYREWFFSPDSAHVVYPAYEDLNQTRWFVVFDGHPGPIVGLIGRIVVSAKGRHLAYWAQSDPRDNKELVVMDGRKGPEYDNISYLTASPDGAHVLYVAEKDRKSCVVMDETPGEAFDGVFAEPYSAGKTPSFTEDGRHMVYEAIQGGEQFVVLDGQLGPRYEAVLSPLALHPNGTIEYLAARDGSLYRVTQKPPRN